MSDGAYELFQRARELLQERRYGEAISLLQEVKRLEPRRGSVLETLGIAYYNSGLPRLAMREFEEALEVDPSNHFARYGLSRCLYRGGMVEMAIGQARLAAVMAPEVEMYVEALRRYGGGGPLAAEGRGLDG
ncbi:MAG: tetratricopeptide repeat protein [Actinomycetota bacterium]